MADPAPVGFRTSEPLFPFELKAGRLCSCRDVDGFALFFREPAEAALRKYFIAGDAHFTELEVRSTVGNY